MNLDLATLEAMRRQHPARRLLVVDSGPWWMRSPAFSPVVIQASGNVITNVLPNPMPRLTASIVPP